jgi:hypothetical protein
MAEIATSPNAVAAIFVSSVALKAILYSPTAQKHFFNLYGASWAKTQPSPILTRTHSAVGMTFTPSIGSTSGHSSFDNVYPWSHIRLCNVVNAAVTAYEGEPGFTRTPAIGDVMVEIPAYYYRVDDSALTRNFGILNLIPRPQGHDKIYVGAYTCNAAYRSVSGNASLVSITRATARTGCANRGDAYWQYDYATFWTIAILFMVEVANLDSQAAVARGHVDNSPAAQLNTGNADAVAWHSGGTGANRAMKYRHIENLWGNIWVWADGFILNNPAVWINLNPATWSDTITGNYTQLSYNQVATASASYIRELGFDPNMPWAMVPTVVTGADGQFFSDQAWTEAGLCILALGGSWANVGGSGLFAYNSGNSMMLTNPAFGSRLLILP